MKKRIIAISFVLFALSGCIIQDEPDTLHYVSSRPELSECNLEKTVNERESCYFDIAIDRNSEILCGEIGSLSLKNICMQKVAQALSNPKICLKIQNDDMRYTECIRRT